LKIIYEKELVMKTTTSQKIGSAIFVIGTLYMFGLGWVYSWKMVPDANELGSAAYSNLLGLFWVLSVPVGAFIVAIGAALAAGAERRVLWMLILLMALFTVWRIVGTTGTFIPALFGIGGGLITLFFIGSVWNWAKTRPMLTGAAQTGSDLRMVGRIFFVVAAWDLCGIFGIAKFVLIPELAEKFSISLSGTINSASGVNILLALGWAFTYFGQLMSRREYEVNPEANIVPQVAAD
jgi:hypothetical protein